MARWFIHEPNTAPIAPQSCSRGSCGNGLPVRFSTIFLYSSTTERQSSALRSVSIWTPRSSFLSSSASSK